jgi:hypothetical protein
MRKVGDMSWLMETCILCLLFWRNNAVMGWMPMLYAGIHLSDLPRLRRCNMGEYAAAFSVSNDQVHHRRLIDCGGKKKSNRHLPYW